jgi:hypothetical protein
MLLRAMVELGVDVSSARSGVRRGKYAREHTTDPNFSLRAHLTKTIGIATVICAFGLWLARDATVWHWAAFPVFWIVANFFEWTMHRFPMHRPLQPRIMYTNHALVHHYGFQGPDQEVRSTSELSVVMMPWYTLLMLFAMASPIAFVAAMIGGVPLAGVFLVSAVGYFLLYETIHTLHHLPMALLERSWIGRLRALRSLRAHHHHHHQLGNMAHTNFNVTAPLADAVLGTYFAEKR